MRAAIAATCLLLLVSPRAEAIRPFITDDARVVGRRLLQLETWAYVDRNGLQHWILPAFGPTDFLEITVGIVHGAALRPEVGYALAGPLFQTKILVRPPIPNNLPGVALSGGAFPPIGVGEFRLARWSGFAYLALTESLLSEDRVLVHANLGFSLTRNDEATLRGAVTAGVGTQVRVYRLLNFVAEVVYGDPYRGGGGAAFQTGFRFILNDSIQLDTTVGRGFAGEERAPLWGSAGFRIVSSRLW